MSFVSPRPQWASRGNKTHCFPCGQSLSAYCSSWMLVETGEKIFWLSLDTGKQSGNISIPGTRFSTTIATFFVVWKAIQNASLLTKVIVQSASGRSGWSHATNSARLLLRVSSPVHVLFTDLVPPFLASMDPRWFEAFPYFNNLPNYGFVFVFKILVQHVCQKWTFAAPLYMYLLSGDQFKI